MCNLTKDFDTPKIVTGYKFALKSGDKYYSPATGVEYKVGKVAALPRKIGERQIEFSQLTHFLVKDIINRQWGYKRHYKNLTAVFVYKKDARFLLFSNYIKSPSKYKGVLLRMKILAKHEGHYQNRSIFAGSEILSMKEVKS